MDELDIAMRTPIANGVAESLHGHYSRGKSAGVARRIARPPRDNLWDATQLDGWLVQFLNDRVALTGALYTVSTGNQSA